MNNQNDVALANTVNGGGLRVGETNTGVFVGSTLVAGKEFDWSKLYSNLSFIASNYTGQNFLLVIANLSSYDINLYRITQDAVSSNTTVEAGKIDWFSIGYVVQGYVNDAHNYKLENIAEQPIRYTSFFCERTDRDEDNYFNVESGINSQGVILERSAFFRDFEVLQYADVIFIFDN